MQDQWYTFTMFDIQSIYVRDIILGKKDVLIAKTKDEMIKDNKEWMENEKKSWDSDEKMINFQTEYVIDVAKQLPKSSLNEYVKNVCDLDCSKEFIEWEHDKHENILTYRDKSFISKINGEKAIKYDTTWVKAFDDSFQRFVNAKK